MGAFEDFVTLELPKRPWTEADGQPGQVLARTADPAKRLGLEWVDPSGAKISSDSDNSIRSGSDGGLFAQQFDWTTTQW